MKNIYRVRATVFLYLVSVVLYLLFFCIDNLQIKYICGLNISSLYNLSIILVILLLILRIFIGINDYSLREIFFFACCEILFSIVTIITDNYILFLLCLFIFCGKRISYKLLYKVVCISYILFVSFIAFFAITGIIENELQYGVNPFDNNSFMVRNPLGFSHVNILGSIVLAIFVSIIILSFRYINFLFYALSVFLSLLLYFLINTKTTSLVILISILLIYIFKCINNKKIFVYFSKFIFLMMMILSFLMPILYSLNFSLFEKINSSLSNRLYFADYFINTYPVTLFGNNIHFISTQDASNLGLAPLVLDNSYVHLLIHFGLLSFVIFFALYYRILDKCLYSNHFEFAICLIIFLICGLFENWLFMIQFNIVLFGVYNFLSAKRSNAECVSNM